MRKLLLSGVGVAATLVAACPAFAGGQWEGSYLGVSVGYGDHQARYEDPFNDWYGSTHQDHQNGVIYGVQGGHNWQDRNFAWGVELDFLGTSIDREQLFDSRNRVTDEVNWVATLRPRAGFALGDTFVYHTAGLAVGDFDRSWIENGDADDSWPDLGDTKLGVAGGFGVERSIGGNWSVRTEAQALRFFENTTINGFDFPLKIDDTIFELKAGVNYALGGRNNGGGTFVQGRPFDFSGFYVGLDVGGHMATIQLSDTEYDDYGATYDLLSNGIAGALHGGWNNQINGFVYGLEAAFNFYGGDDATNDAGFSPYNTSNLNWGGDVKFKAGAAADNTMMYVSAGYAFRDYDLTREDSDIWDMSGTHSGFVVGTGIEQAFTPNLTGRIEAAYGAVGGDTAPSPTNTNRFRGAAQDVTLMAGVSYYMGENAMGAGALAPSNWAGFYAGLDGLFAYHQGSIFDLSGYDNGGNYTVPSFGAGAGMHVGHDWQSDTFVYGLVADFAFFTNDENDTSPNNRRIASSLNWMGTVRGRAGVATGQALFYATGGVAYGDADLALEFLPAPNFSSFIFDNSRIGWTAGLGVERAISDRSSFKLETLYTKFGEESDVNGNGSPSCLSAAGLRPCEMLGYDDTITVKVGYSLRWSGM